MKLINEVLLDLDDVLIKPKRSVAASRSQVKIDREFQFYHSPKTWNGFPLMVSNLKATGVFSVANSMSTYKGITCLHKFHTSYPKEFSESPYTWVTTGIDDSDTLKTFINNFDKEHMNLVVDVPNGYTNQFVKTVSQYRKRFPNSIICAGNVATPNMVEELIMEGADIVKIGIGPGAACQTRLLTGVGYPMLSSCLECADAAHGLKSAPKRIGLICADGGLKNPGDICKVFCAGADFAMVGSLFCGVEESEGEWEYAADKVKSRLKYYGMSSYAAQKELYGEIVDYRASEGRVCYSEYKGPLSRLMKEILGGVRSCCAYIGADSIRDMNKCGSFVRVNRVHTNTNWTIE